MTYPSGTLIANRYEVAGRPLIGGMGIVYLCNDRQEDRPVALKTFKPEYLPNRSARDRFLREGEWWIKLGAHHNIVRAYNVVHIGDGREVYLVLELVAKEQGRQDASLRAWLTSGQPLPLDQALLFALQIARGMRHAAATIPGFVHRDLKPENVLVGADHLTDAKINRLRVTDFGLARVLEMGSTEHGADSPQEAGDGTLSPAIGGHRALLTEGGIVGTPEYMAPEQWDGHVVDARADIYALGCILAEMLLGRMVVSATPRLACRELHKSGLALQAVRDLPKDLATMLASCLAVSPSDRYGSWEEVEAAVTNTYRSASGKEAPKEEEVKGETRADRVAVGWSYNAMGSSYVDISKFDVAVGYFERVVQIGQAEKERSLEGAGLGNQGSAYLNLSAARRAIGYYEQSLAIMREIGDRQGEADALGNLGNAYFSLGDARRAIGYYEQSLAITHEIGDRQGEADALGNLGNAYFSLGDARRAIGYYEQTLAITREIGDRQVEGSVLCNLGIAYRNLNNTRLAIEYYEQSLAITREIGDRQGEGCALGNLGLAYGNLNKTRLAIEYYEQSLAITREIGDRQAEGCALGNLGLAYFSLGDARRAIGYYEQHLAIAREIGDRHGEGRALGDLGVSYYSLGDARRAIGYYEQSLGIAREIGDMMGAAKCSLTLALALSKQSQHTEALHYAEYAAQVSAQIGHTQLAQMVQQLITQLKSKE